MTNTLLAAGGLIFAAALFLFPRRWIRRGQDRLAAEILGRAGARGEYLLLTPADRLTGKFRRVPGALGMTRRSLIFESRFEPPFELALSAVRKIVTGKVVSNGRRLWREEVVQLTDSSGALAEFQMSHASAWQWRQHLGVWAAGRRSAGGGVAEP